MTDHITTLVDTYFAMWNEPDKAERARLIEQAWSDDAAYADPAVQAEGHAALGEMVAGVHAQFPGYRFRRLSGVDAHDRHVRFAWELANDAGEVAVGGIDVGELSEDGRLRRITGFFGDLPAA
jgi:hypothetical protein